MTMGGDDGNELRGQSATAADDDLSLERALFNVDDDEFRLFRAAALLPRIEGRAVDLPALESRVGSLAAEVKARVGRSASWPKPLAALLEVLFVERGFCGDVEEYDHPRNSFLDEVMARRRGLP